MQTPFIGNIMPFAGTFAPLGWAFCDGSLMAISQNDALFSLIGTTYGGDGQTTFALPDLRGRMPMHQGPGFVIGQVAGTETVTLTSQQMPLHSHTVIGNSGNANSNDPTNNFLAAQPSLLEYAPGATANATMKSNAILPGGGGNQPHDNIMPYLAISYVIALEGIYPTQN